MEHVRSAQQFLASAPPHTKSLASQKQALEVGYSGPASAVREALGSPRVPRCDPTGARCKGHGVRYCSCCNPGPSQLLAEGSSKVLLEARAVVFG